MLSGLTFPQTREIMLTYKDTVSSLICEILLRAVHWSQLKKQQTECEML